MAAFVKFFCAVVFLTLALGCNGQCSEENLKLSQEPTGIQIQGKTQWRANFTNDCACSLLSIKLDCAGFETTESVDPDILTVSGAVCLLNSGSGGLHPFASVNFTYAWSPQFNFKPLFAQAACSLF